MENTSNPSNQKTKLNLKFFLLNDSNLISQNDLIFETDSYVQNIEDANFCLKYIPNDLIELYTKRKVLLATVHKENLIKSLPFLIRESKEADLSKIDKVFQRTHKFRSKTNELNYYLNQLSTMLNSSDSLVDFMQQIFSFKNLKTFQTIHLFIHEKGQSNSVHFDISRNSFRKYIHNISDFSSLFQSIRKSKNRTYGQSAIKGFSLEILGTFLAHEFSLTNHNLILVISRNDFLPQTEKEIEIFNLLTKVLSSYIEIKLEQNLIRSKVETLKLALKESPFKIYSTNSNLVEFSNSFTDNKVRFRNTSGNYFEVSKLHDSVLDHGDIFHHERVSLLGELLNTLRHELSNPIFGLQLSTQLLLMEEHDDEQTSFLNEILASIKRSQNILENFTSLYKDSNQYEEVELINLIKEVFTLTKSESRHLKKSIRSNKDTILLNTNSTWLAQIIFNLVINSAQACKTVPNAELCVEIFNRDNSIYLKFQDNGPGINLQDSAELFKAFYTTKSKGTGLGLAICKSLARKLSGNIQYVSNDKGAQFLLVLPYENSSN